MIYLSDLPKVIVYDRQDDCKLCGKEMNPGKENYYRGLEICPRCQEEMEDTK